MGIVIRQSIKNLIITYIGLAIGYVGTLILNPLILTEEQIGLVRILVSVSFMFSSFAALGAINIPSKYFPYFNNKEKKHNGFLFFLLLIGFLGFLTFVFIFLIFKRTIYSIYISKAPLLVEYFYYFIPLTFIALYYNIFQSYIIMQQKPVVPSLIREILIRVLTVFSLLIFFFKWTSFHGLIDLIIITYAISFLILAIYTKYLGSLFLRPNLSVFRSKYLKDILSFGGFALLGNVSGLLVANVDGIMLSAYKGLGATGIYTIAFFIATVIEIPKRSISQSIIASISEGNKSNNLKLLKDLYKKTSITQLIMGALIFLGIWCNIDNVFHLIPNGNIYIQGKWVVFFIGLAKFFDLSTGSNYEIISTSKYYRYDLIFIILLGVLAVITNIIFIPLYGMTGAALASALSVLIFNIFRSTFIYLKMRIQPFTINTLKELFIIAITLTINYFLPKQANFILDIILRSSIISIIFIGLTLFFKVSEDFNLIFKNIIKKIKY